MVSQNSISFTVKMTQLIGLVNLFQNHFISQNLDI